MHRIFLAFFLLGFSYRFAEAQQIRSSYATQDGRAGTVVVTCPSTDGSFTAGPCSTAPLGPVTYAAPSGSAIVTPNVAVTVFAAGSVPHSCDIVNSGTDTLYLDFTTTAVAGAATSIPLLPGQSYHCPFPPAGAVSAVADMAQPFVAVRY
jgi:hypothetical protein